MMKPVTAFLFLMIGISSISKAQFSHADTLRGSDGPARVWWDVLKYDIHVSFNLKDSTIDGFNVISYRALKEGQTLQIDLQVPMQLDSVLIIAHNPVRYVPGDPGNLVSTGQRVTDFTRDGNVYFIHLPAKMPVNSSSHLTLYYHGKPTIAKNPPWDGGIIFKRDKAGYPWVSIACQGTGASIWYPCKDYQGDEPDSAELHITVPADLVAVSNGRLRGKKANADGTATYSWAVVAPINNYCIIPYIGKYVSFSEIYKGEKGNLDMAYWVLDSNLEKAKKQFTDAPRMMKAFEYWFGPYPFYEDGYKLVDAPHLGMEHQSATAYGNGYQNGYYGTDLSGTGWGMKWDFIIVHESGHEWFGNNITTKDIADMWVHESFTNYSETLFTEFYYGRQAADAYVTGCRKRIVNDKPIIGPYAVNREGSTDMYYKGGNMLHTIRQVINDDEKFRKILRGLNQTFYHTTVTGKQVENYISSKSGINFSKVFDQYLRTVKIPVLEYKIFNGKLSYKWMNCVPGFDMPVKVMLHKDHYDFIYPSEKSKLIVFDGHELKEDERFYIKMNQLK
ncbi:MAG: M1 family metallopeptidase [Ginsengibacter sp.]